MCVRAGSGEGGGSAVSGVVRVRATGRLAVFGLVRAVPLLHH